MFWTIQMFKPTKKCVELTWLFYGSRRRKILPGFYVFRFVFTCFHLFVRAGIEGRNTVYFYHQFITKTLKNESQKVEAINNVQNDPGGRNDHVNESGGDRAAEEDPHYQIQVHQSHHGLG